MYIGMITQQNYNICQKSWNTCIISAAHLVVSSSSPQNNVVIYSAERYRKSRFACRPFSDKETLNSRLFLGGGRGFPSFYMDKKIIFIGNYASINWCSKDFWQRLYVHIEKGSYIQYH